MITTILAIGGGIGTAVGLIGKFWDAIDKTTFPGSGVAGPGVGVIGLSAFAAAAVVVLTAIAYWWDRCHTPDGLESCSAGVIDTIVPTLSDTASAVFPFTAQHDLVSVVTQCQYWPLVELNAAYVYTNPTDSSPEAHCYFHNDVVCAIEAGATIGAVIGAVAGIALGIIAGAALGCVASGPFYPLCLLLACLIAALVAAAVTLLGAMIGGYIGGSVVGAIPHPTTDDGSQPKVGDYITTCGKTIVYGADQGARVYWFVEHSALHGHSTAGAGQQWIHADPDGNMPLDTCASLCPKNFTGIPDPTPIQ